MSYWLNTLIVLFVIITSFKAYSCPDNWNMHNGMKHGRNDGHMMCGGMMEGMLPEITTLPKPGSTGAKLVMKYCSQCHNTPSPSLHHSKEWDVVFKRMLQRMDMMGGRWMRVASPSKKERTAILNYLKDNSMKVFEEKEFELGSSPVNQAFKNTCVQCHNLPSPKQHKASEWSDVVSRMTGHMKNAGIKKPTTKQLEGIITFLKQNASK